MRHPTRPWPKIVATLVAGLAMSGIFGSARLTFGGGGYPLASWIAFDRHALLAAAVLLAAVYPLATGRDWARRTLLIAVATVGVTMTVWYLIRIVSPVSFSDLTPEQAAVSRRSMRFEDLSTLCWIAAFTFFGVSFLSHPDVVTSFTRPHAPPK
ncbi:MAG: hypothetical protein QOJ45_2186 [Verrucomicrobiota bacterium]